MSRKTDTPARKTGATRRRSPQAERAPSRFDRWLDDLVSWSVATALLVGGLAVLVTLVW